MQEKILKKEAEFDDPLEMIGVEIPCSSEAELRDMVLCFAEEFLRDGYDEEKLMRMFRSPFYQGPHLAWKQKGDDYIRGVIREAMDFWKIKRE